MKGEKKVTERCDWSGHHDQTKEYPPSPLLPQVLAYVRPAAEGAPRKALDLGSGPLKDSRLLLAEGFQVTAIDQLAPKPEVMTEFARKPLRQVTSLFIDADFSSEKFDLINAMFALPFNPPDIFAKLWPRVKVALAPQGIFCGKFFGPRDGWYGDPYATFHTSEEVRALFTDMDIISFQEEELDRPLANGKPKHWHRMNVIARKPSI